MGEHRGAETGGQKGKVGQKEMVLGWEGVGGGAMEPMGPKGVGGNVGRDPVGVRKRENIEGVRP